MSLPNWHQERDMFSPHALLDSFARDGQGRKTSWKARVFLYEGKWRAGIERRSGRFACFQIEPDGAWDFFPFDSSQEAMEHVEEYITIRRNPNTWHGSHRESCQQRLAELESKRAA